MMDPDAELTLNGTPHDGVLLARAATRRRLALWALAWLIALELLVAWRLTPPSPLPLDAAPSAFSATRARAVLSRILVGDEPHPTGSAAQADVRRRLATELRGLGLEPMIQSGVACSPQAVCAELHNVVARIPGTLPTLAVALMAHYDSVPAGPGAGDDGQGVASLLEIARALRAAPPQAGVLLVFTDGEELGLLGARLFVESHPLAGAVRVVLNLEARGNRGPSMMFETTPDSAWLIGRFQSAPRPVSSSLFAAVYRAMPNDTDLSVLAQRGAQGLNFAFVGGVGDYHTPRDNLARLDWRSVQQQGAAALATLRAITAQGVEAPDRDAVFFDVLGSFVVRLPITLMSPVAAIVAALFALMIWREARSDPGYMHAIRRAALGLCGGWALAGLLAAGLGWLLTQLGALPFPIVANPWPLLLGAWALAVAGHALVWRVTHGSRRRLAAWDASWLCWLGVGVGLLIVVPQASYLALLPALLAAGARPWLGSEVSDRRAVLLMLPGAAAAALLWLPILTLLHQSIGLASPAVLSLAFAVGLSPCLLLLGPWLEGRRSLGALLALGSVACLGQGLFAPYSAEVPQRLCLVLDVDPAGDARWLADASAGPLPEGLRAAAEFTSTPSHEHPWPGYGQGQMFAAAAAPPPPSELPSTLTTLAPDSLRLTLRASEQMWALGVRVRSPAPLRQVQWRGQGFPPTRSGDEQRFVLIVGQERSISLDLQFDGALPAEVELSEIRLGLPREGDTLSLARGSTAVASGFGDLTTLRHTVALAAPRILTE
jgi:peptidase M28-like protein